MRRRRDHLTLGRLTAVTHRYHVTKERGEEFTLGYHRSDHMIEEIEKKIGALE